MPYGFAGLAVGRADVTRFASVTGTKTTQKPDLVVPGGVIVFAPDVGLLDLPRNPQSLAQSGLTAYGFTAGLGVEVALMQTPRNGLTGHPLPRAYYHFMAADKVMICAV